MAETAVRSKGAVMLALQAEKGASWAIEPEKEMTLRFELTNRGGPLRGAYIEIGGPAIAQAKIIAAVDVTAGSQKPVAFVAKPGVYRAELPEFQVDAGFPEEKSFKRGAPPAPAQPTASLEIRLRGEKGGSGLLTVRVGALAAKDTSGSALQGKNVTVGK